MKSMRLAVALIVAAASGSAWTSRSEAASRRAAPAVNQTEDRSVSCLDNRDKGFASAEKLAFGTAPEGARRVSDHVLEVRTKAGVRRFVDRRPYRDGLDGFHWLYCGYDPGLKAHLIGVQDDSLFTGKLVFDGDGHMVDGGQTVYSSADGSQYLAESQVNGEYLSHWVVFDRAGRRLWAGLSGTDGTHNNTIEYGDLRWTPDDTLRATATCGDGKGETGEAILVREGKTWRWKSDLRC